MLDGRVGRRRSLRHGAPTRRAGVHIATPVFDGADRGGDQGRARARPAADSRPDRALRRPHRRAVRQRRHRRHHVHAEAAPPGRRQDPRALDRPVLASSPSSRWAARRSSAASGSARWRCGRSRPTAPPTRCRSSSRSSRTTSSAARACTSRSSRARLRSSRACRSRFNVLIKELQSLGLDVELLEAPSPTATRRARASAGSPTMRRSLVQSLREAEGSAQLRRDPDRDRLAGEDPRVVVRRGEEARDDQLPDLQAGTRRALLRQDLRSGQGLRVQLRQVQAHEAPRRSSARSAASR